MRTIKSKRRHTTHKNATRDLRRANLHFNVRVNNSLVRRRRNKVYDNHANGKRRLPLTLQRSTLNTSNIVALQRDPSNDVSPNRYNNVPYRFPNSLQISRHSLFRRNTQRTKRVLFRATGTNTTLPINSIPRLRTTSNRHANLQLVRTRRRLRRNTLTHANTTRRHSLLPLLRNRKGVLRGIPFPVTRNSIHGFRVTPNDLPTHKQSHTLQLIRGNVSTPSAHRNQLSNLSLRTRTFSKSRSTKSMISSNRQDTR